MSKADLCLRLAKNLIKMAKSEAGDEAPDLEKAIAEAEKIYGDQSKNSDFYTGKPKQATLKNRQASVYSIRPSGAAPHIKPEEIQASSPKEALIQYLKGHSSKDWVPGSEEDIELLGGNVWDTRDGSYDVIPLASTTSARVAARKLAKSNFDKLYRKAYKAGFLSGYRKAKKAGSKIAGPENHCDRCGEEYPPHQFCSQCGFCSDCCTCGEESLTRKAGDVSKFYEEQTDEGTVWKDRAKSLKLDNSKALEGRGDYLNEVKNVKYPNVGSKDMNCTDVLGPSGSEKFWTGKRANAKLAAEEALLDEVLEKTADTDSP